jgi:hypothetical protein
MAYSITTQDGITINNIPDDVPPDSQILKDRVASIRAGQTESAPREAAPRRGIGEELVRQAGLTARSVPGAAAQVLGLVGDPLNALVNMITGSRLQTISGATENLLTQAGLPEPQTPTERAVYDITRAGMGAALPGAAISRLRPQAPVRVAPQARAEPTFVAPASPESTSAAIERAFAQNLGLQTTGAVGGSLASQLAAQAGAGPVGQAVSGLIGGVAAPATVQTTAERLAVGGKEIVRPFTEAGREVIAGNVLRQLSAQPDVAMVRAAGYEPPVTGYQPTTAQATRDIGLIAAETPLRALDTTGRFAAQASQANQARLAILDRMARDQDTLASAIAKRDEVTAPLRESAFAKSTVTPETLQSSITLTVGKTIDDILASAPGARKPVKDAMQFARDRLKDGTTPERLYAVRQDLRDAAQGLLNKEDAAYSLAKGQLEQVIRSVDDVLDSAAPGYKDYLNKYATSSRGIERLEAVQDFRKKVLTTTPDPGRVSDYLISQPAFTRAIRALQDDPKLGGLSKTQFGVLQRVSRDLDDGVLARAAKSPGSDTFRNMSTANVIGGIIGKQMFGETSPFLNKVASPLNFLYNGSDDAIREVLVDAMLDPKLAAKLMQKATTATVKPIAEELQRRAINLGYGSIFGLTE